MNAFDFDLVQKFLIALLLSALVLQSPLLFIMVVIIVALVATVAFIMENRRLNNHCIA
ncbi:hypothetical protein [Arsukibacterium sp. MJ3]|uniref:hypothetical protein n=1 Tax=Arsukibacterium sp. MJ3 TaxID=1632859 RepID=UPI001F1A5BCF|nr:hypothetical protein [Arsukibacterium sp. MJ3]